MNCKWVSQFFIISPAFPFVRNIAVSRHYFLTKQVFLRRGSLIEVAFNTKVSLGRDARQVAAAGPKEASLSIPASTSVALHGRPIRRSKWASA